MQESRERKLGAMLSYVSIVVNTLIQLLYTPLLIRILGQSEYGLYSLVASMIGYLTIMDLGFANAIIVYTTKYRAQNNVDAEKKLHGMFHVIFKIIGVVAALIGILLFFSVDLIFSSKMNTIELQKMKIMMLILSFNLFLSFYFAIYSSIISAYEKFTFQKVIVIIQSLLKPLLMLPLLFLGFKSITLCVVITISNALYVLSNYIYCKKKLNASAKFVGFDWKIFRIIINYSIWIFIGVIVDKINWSVDNFVLGAVSGTIAVSIYSIASTLNQLFVSLSTAISGVLLPKVSKMVAKNASSEEMTKEFIKVGRIQYYIIFLMVSGLILVGKDFFHVWAGSGYEDSYAVSLLLIVPVCIPLIQNLGVSIRQAMNKHKFSALLRLAVAIINLFISVPLASKFGPVGAALGTCIGLSISTFIHNIYYYKVIKLDMIRFWKEIIKMSIPFVIPWVVALLVKFTFPLTGIASIIVIGGVFTIVYIPVSYFLCMNYYEKSIVHNLEKKIVRIIRRKK